MIKTSLYIICFCFTVLLTSTMQEANAQFKVRGTVYDSSGIYPLEAVSVLTTSGRGTQTDISGKYEVDVNEKDSIWFSYLGKPTIKYPVLKMMDPLNFDISILISIPVLREVRVLPRNYKLDSMQNRIDYAKGFNFQRPKLKPNIGSGMGGAAVGFDLDEIIRMFQFRKNRYMLKFQERLMQQERDKFIDHRFNRQLVRRLTNLINEQLDSFMVIYKPPYEFVLTASDYELQSYIKNCYEDFIKSSSPPKN